MVIRCGTDRGGIRGSKRARAAKKDGVANGVTFDTPPIKKLPWSSSVTSTASEPLLSLALPGDDSPERDQRDREGGGLLRFIYLFLSISAVTKRRHSSYAGASRRASSILAWLKRLEALVDQRVIEAVRSVGALRGMRTEIVHPAWLETATGATVGASGARGLCARARSQSAARQPHHADGPLVAGLQLDDRRVACGGYARQEHLRA